MCKVGMLVSPIQPTQRQLDKPELASTMQWRIGRVGVVLRVYESGIKVPLRIKKTGEKKKQNLNKAYIRWFNDQTEQWVNTKYLQEVE
jgi:hypothetical protein